MLSPVMRCFYFSYHYKLPFDVYAYTFDICTSKVYLLTYLQLARLIVLSVLLNTSYDGTALSVDDAVLLTDRAAPSTDSAA